MTDARQIRSTQADYLRLVESWVSPSEYPQLLTASTSRLSAEIMRLMGGPQLHLSPSARRRSVFEYKCDGLIRDVKTFWRERAASFRDALRNVAPYAITLQSQRLVGDLPSAVRRLGIYFDAVTMVDPIALDTEEDLNLVLNDPQGRAFKLTMILRLAHAIQMREAWSNDLDIPIFFIVPPVSRDLLDRQARNDAAVFIPETCLDRDDITTEDDLRRYVVARERELDKGMPGHDTFQQLLRRFDKPASLLVEANVLTEEMRRPQYRLAQMPTGRQFQMLHWYSAAAFNNASETVSSAANHGIDPVLYRGNEILYRWLGERWGKRIVHDAAGENEETVAASALLSDDLQLLEAVNLAALLDFRRRGEMEDLRNALRLARAEFKAAGRRGIDSAVSAFARHARDTIAEFGAQLAAKKTEIRARNVKVAVSLGLSTALTALGLALPSVALVSLIGAGVSVAIGGSSIRDLYLAYRAGGSELDALYSTPLSLLYETYEKSVRVPEQSGRASARAGRRPTSR